MAGAGAQAAPYTPYASTPGEAAVGAMLDAGTSGGERAAMLSSIDALPTAAGRADALGQLSPRSYTLLPRLAIQSMDAADRQIRAYLAERRSIALDAPATVPTRGEGRITMMLTGGVKQARYEARTDRPEADSDSRSLRFAIDVKPVPKLIVGATLGIDGIDARLDRAQRPRITQFNSSIGGYASYSDGRFYIDATAAYNFAEYKLRRQLRWSGFTDRMIAPTDGDGWAVSGEAGAMLRAGAVRLQPFAGLHHRYADVAGFVENGGAAALQLADYRNRSLRGAIGARASANLSAGRWTLRPTIEALWQRELSSRPQSRIEARLASGGLPVFALQPTRLARNAALLSAALSATASSRTSFRIGYDGELATDRHVDAATLTLSRRF